MGNLDNDTIQKYLNTSIELFDEQKLLKTAGNSNYRIKSLIESFEGTTTRSLKEMHRALENNNLDKIVDNCNDLILLAGDIGGNRMLLAIDNIKSAAKNNQLSQISTLFIIIQAEVEKLCGELQNFYESMS